MNAQSSNKINKFFPSFLIKFSLSNQKKCKYTPHKCLLQVYQVWARESNSNIMNLELYIKIFFIKKLLGDTKMLNKFMKMQFAHFESRWDKIKSYISHPNISNLFWYALYFLVRHGPSNGKKFIYIFNIAFYFVF